MGAFAVKRACWAAPVASLWSSGWIVLTFFAAAGFRAGARSGVSPGGGDHRGDRGNHPVRDRRAAGQLGRLTPKHRESDITVRRGHVTKQGSRLLRWALIEAIQRARAGSWPGDVKDAIIARRGKQARNVAKVAAARRLLTLVYYGPRDGQIRCLPEPAPAA